MYKLFVQEFIIGTCIVQVPIYNMYTVHMFNMYVSIWYMYVVYIYILLLLWYICG